jgi:CTP:molybdopterin cytidylyltransferase MocA
MTCVHGAIVLAAGASSRLGQAKQLVEIDGEPLVRRAARFALATRPRECVVVLGHDAKRVGAALDGLAVRTIVADEADRGIGASLRAGVAALDAACAAALVVVTDQLALDASHLRALCEVWCANPGRAIASAYAGVIGVPVVLPRAWFEALTMLDRHVGARDLLRMRRDDVVAISAPQLAFDLDTPSDLADARARV